MRHYKTLIFVLASTVILLPSAGKAAKPLSPPPSNTGTESGGFGSVNFPVSCASQVQAAFNKGVAQLDSFQYEQSQKTFAEVAKQDPHCAMAYWGQAMSLYHQLWDWPKAATLKTGRQLIEKAQQAGAASPREREYIQAAAIYYPDNPKLDDEARAVAYSQGLAKLHQDYPTDEEGAAFYALSLIAIRTPDKAEEMANRKQAIAILDKLFVEEPDNPGVAHYLIHASDTPALAPLGLKAARRYAEIAPGSAHALHMPSHIFTDLGFWQESIQSNIASARAAQQATTSGEYNASGHQLHAMTFLEYAYLESGQDDAARHVIQDLQKVPGTKGNQIADEQADFSVEYATETHNWKRAENLTFAPGLYPVEKEQIDLARAIGAARSGNVTAARADIKNLIREQAAMAKGKSSPSAMKSESMDQLMAESWLAWAEGSGDQALAKMEAAVKMEDDEAWKDGDAAVQIPPREMLADLLLELQQPQKALTQYEAVLKLSPNRFDSVYGAARAAQAAGDVATAHQYFTELTKICGPHADRPELQQAREYLAEK